MPKYDLTGIINKANESLQSNKTTELSPAAMATLRLVSQKIKNVIEMESLEVQAIEPQFQDSQLLDSLDNTDQASQSFNSFAAADQASQSFNSFAAADQALKSKIDYSNPQLPRQVLVEMISEASTNQSDENQIANKLLQTQPYIEIEILTMSAAEKSKLALLRKLSDDLCTITNTIKSIDRTVFGS